MTIKKRKSMLPFQPVRLAYGFASGDNGQDIPVVNRAVGGPGLYIKWTTEDEDPYSHHGTNGISVVNGPTNSNGSWISGTLKLWIVDLWDPTEFQVFPTKCSVNSDGSSGPDVSDSRILSVEDYAPGMHDTLLWTDEPDENGDYHLIHDHPGHSPSVKHFVCPIEETLTASQRLRINIAQYHDNPLIPDIGKPYPGWIRKAVLELEVYPR